MNFHTIKVSSSKGAGYSIRIGSGLLGARSTWSELRTASKIAIVTDQTVARLYGSKVANAMPFKPEIISINDGEESKAIRTAIHVIDQLVAKQHDRASAIVALGGGVVGDVAGFVASCYMRGVSLIHAPTTLLAQVDSAIGGKNGLNLPAGKNLIGSFYNPSLVIEDVDTLQSLPDRIHLEGLAEVIKYGVIADAQFFDWLEANRGLLINRDPGALRHVIYWSCKIKSSIVQKDETDHGIRSLLNFGHTFGHAIENLAGLGVLLHGEAVAVGMAIATDLSVKLGICTSEVANRIQRLLRLYGLPSTLSHIQQITPRRLIEAMTMDKKAIGGKIHFVLIHGIGNACIVDDVPSDLVESAIRSVLQPFN